MLTVDLVRARRRKGELTVSQLTAKSLPLARELASDLIRTAEQHVGRERGEITEAWNSITAGAPDPKLAGGLRKLVEDRCVFESGGDSNPRDLRRELFERAFAARAAGDFDRQRILDETAEAISLTTAELESRMYSDLKDQHRLVEFKGVDADTLVAGFNQAQCQAVLLKASRVVAQVTTSDPNDYRFLFRKLKFRRLLHRITPHEDGYRIEIDGPLSLFSQVTKYGLGLALVLPAIQACDKWSIEADLVWGKKRERLVYRLAGERAPLSNTDSTPEPVRVLMEKFRKLKTGWSVEVGAELLNLPGVGIVVPDLRFTDDSTGEVVFLEVLGFWSRDAVWKRVELVTKGLPDQVIFAVSKRLRVSEAVLPEDLPGQLYVYKGTMNAKEIARRLEEKPKSVV